MGTIVCKECDQIIEHYEHEKVEVLYASCNGCPTCEEE
ncbi:GapA-binding peptide SR1P [Aneurinibacillus sp. UBA3580]|jgi:Pyruvate/2-oxoacid:ferredoxin oxidoreductase delta subunit|nr:GapA-binding peptide SR1P [Aneurinibacillus sp. UBA3580]